MGARVVSSLLYVEGQTCCSEAFTFKAYGRRPYPEILTLITLFCTIEQLRVKGLTQGS